MKKELNELKQQILKIAEDPNFASLCTYDFRDYTEEIAELNKFIADNNITNIKITNNNGFGIGIEKGEN